MFWKSLECLYREEGETMIWTLDGEEKKGEVGLHECIATCKKCTKI